MVGIVLTLNSGEYLVSLRGKVAFEAGAVNLVSWRFKGDVFVGIGFLAVGIIAEKRRLDFGFFI